MRKSVIQVDVGTMWADPVCSGSCICLEEQWCLVSKKKTEHHRDIPVSAKRWPVQCRQGIPSFCVVVSLYWRSGVAVRQCKRRVHATDVTAVFDTLSKSDANSIGAVMHRLCVFVRTATSTYR